MSVVDCRLPIYHHSVFSFFFNSKIYTLSFRARKWHYFLSSLFLRIPSAFPRCLIESWFFWGGSALVSPSAMMMDEVYIMVTVPFRTSRRSQCLYTSTWRSLVVNSEVVNARIVWVLSHTRNKRLQELDLENPSPLHSIWVGNSRSKSIGWKNLFLRPLFSLWFSFVGFFQRLLKR